MRRETVRAAQRHMSSASRYAEPMDRAAQLGHAFKSRVERHSRRVSVERRAFLRGGAEGSLLPRVSHSWNHSIWRLPSQTRSFR
jgi:hypothetical protein